jgi:enoyl-CoA hydratase/carnithine racemase
VRLMSGENIQSFGDIRLEGRGAYAVLTIEREAKRNAMNRSAREGMLHALEQARDRYSVVVLTGAGNVFCAGIDLKERARDVEQGIHTASQEWKEVNVAIRSHPAVFIAAVNGIALGGGATLINVCDLAIAADTAEIGMPEMTFATYPGLAGPSTQLSLGRKRVAWMVLTAERISAVVAERWGLVNQCVPASDLMMTAEALASRIAKFEPLALSGAKSALDQIPATITDWRQAFDFGEMVNATIRSKTGRSNPFATALPSSGPVAQ